MKIHAESIRIRAYHLSVLIIRHYGRNERLAVVDAYAIARTDEIDEIVMICKQKKWYEIMLHFALHVNVRAPLLII